MYNILIAKYGEIGVKGKNRYIFENKLIRNIRNMLKPMGKFNATVPVTKLAASLMRY